MKTELTQKIKISHTLLEKYNDLPLINKLLLMAKYFSEFELTKNINNYINMEKSYKNMADQLLEAGFELPSSGAVVSFFQNKILNIYHDECIPDGIFITWLNNNR